MLDIEESEVKSNGQIEELLKRLMKTKDLLTPRNYKDEGSIKYLKSTSREYKK